MVSIIRTWNILTYFAPINHRLDFSWGRNQGLGSVEPSAHDPSTVSLYVLALPSCKANHAACGKQCCCLQGRVRPDLTVVASSLLLFVGEEKAPKAGLGAAYDDIRKKFREGLSPLYYQNITFIPFMIAAGEQLRFGILHHDGKVTHNRMLCAAQLQAWPHCKCRCELTPADHVSAA